MSASREKKTRQETDTVWSDPKTAREAQQRKEERRSNILYGTIAVVFVLVAVAAIIWKSNIIPKSATAATVNGEKYTAAEVNFHYYNLLSQSSYYMSMMGIDPRGDLRAQQISEDQTWFDYISEQALNQIADIQALKTKAAADGFTWNDELQAQFDATMDSLSAAAASSGYSGVSQYLKAVYGPLMTKKVYEAQLKDSMLAQAYVQNYQDGLTYTDEQLTAGYEADRNAYDKVSYESVRVSGAADTQDADGNDIEVTDEMEAAAKAAAKETADGIYAGFQAGGSLETLAEADEKATYSASESGTYTDSTLMNWLFDDSRKAGDAAVLEDGADSIVVTFRDRFREDYNTVDVRHILVMVDETGLDSASETYEADLQAKKDEAKAKAEDLLAQWKAGEATEDAFAAMANEHSEDGGSNTNGGLYEQVPQGQMVKEFNDWCFDAAHKSGDTGVVYGESANYKGYHVMYFVGTDLPYWQVQVRSTLSNEDASAWYETQTEGVTVEQDASGMKYVG